MGETLLHKPTPSQPFEKICMSAILDRLRMTGQTSVLEDELKRRMVGRYFEMRTAQEIPGVLSVAQLRTFTGMDKIIETKINSVHSVPDIFSYQHIGWRKTHPLFEIDGIGEIKGLTEEEGLEFLDALYLDNSTNKKRIQKALHDGGFPLSHKNRYSSHIERIPLRFSPENATEWTINFFSQFNDPQISLSDDPYYALLLPCDTYQAMLKKIKNNRFNCALGIEELFQSIGVHRVECLPWSRKEADEFAGKHLPTLKGMVSAIQVIIK